LDCARIERAGEASKRLYRLSADAPKEGANMPDNHFSISNTVAVAVFIAVSFVASLISVVMIKTILVRLDAIEQKVGIISHGK
jgi:hypothetical protein